MKKFIFTPLFLLIILIAFPLLTLSGCKDGGNDNSMAQFTGGSLTTQDLDAHYKQLKRSRTFKNKTQLLTPEFVFDHALNMEMIIAKGIDEKLHLDPTIRAKIHEFMADMFIKIMQDKLVPKINKEDFTNQELKAFYDKHKDNYQTRALYSVWMINTQTKESAQEAIEKIRAGQLDFKGAAAKYSMDKKSKNQGGNIGARALSKFRQDWQPVISSLEIKQVSGPHKIKDSYYVFKLINKTKPVLHSFEDKKAYVKNDLLYTRYKEEWQSTYDSLKKEFKVKINQKNLKAFITSDGSLERG